MSMDELRAREFSRLDEAEHVYLDYTGGGLYGESQIRAHADLLTQNVFGNPHSQNPSSLASTQHVEGTRARIGAFFDADPAEYEVVFTLNASGALKLVGESYPFEQGSRYVLTSDNHNSVNGIREFATPKGAVAHYVPLNNELRIADAELEKHLTGADPSKPNLLAYPSQSNFSGVKHPLAWIEEAHSLGYDVLLDAAAFVPTNPFSLREVKPDFVTLSFYKMFGFPTGVGALIARRDALAKLQRPWFAGGTVRFASAQNQLHLLQGTGEAFEDGTLNYLSIAGVTTGLDFLRQVGMQQISQHVMGLTEILLENILALRHSNGEPVVKIYGPRTLTERGGTVAFNVQDPNGEEVDFKVVEQHASEANISIRTGCFCNPGAAEAAFDYEQEDTYACFYTLTPEGFTLQQFSACLDDQPVGAVRASLGIASNEADVRRFSDLVASFIDCDPAPVKDRVFPEVVSD
jgi:selenocysteine lyase/cysteine desulfurase